MIETLHAQLVADLSKDPRDILTLMTPSKADLLHAILGIVSEAGELADAIKKHTMYAQPLDIANVVEELGDLEFFMEMLRQRLGLQRETTLTGNIEKLEKRYPLRQYSDRLAKMRLDKLSVETNTFNQDVG